MQGERYCAPVLSVNDKTSVLDIWQKLLERKELITIVVDDYGGMRGVITMEDVVETMLGAEIIDEDDLAPDLQSYAREKWERIRKSNSVCWSHESGDSMPPLACVFVLREINHTPAAMQSTAATFCHVSTSMPRAIPTVAAMTGCM